jgi:hypothetical protein
MAFRFDIDVKKANAGSPSEQLAEWPGDPPTKQKTCPINRPRHIGNRDFIPSRSTFEIAQNDTRIKQLDRSFSQFTSPDRVNRQQSIHMIVIDTAASAMATAEQIGIPCGSFTEHNEGAG